MKKEKFAILKNGDFTIRKYPGIFSERENFERLEDCAREKLFNKKELDGFVADVEIVAKACGIELNENYYKPYNKYFFGFYANRAQAHSYGSGDEVRCAIDAFNTLRDFLVGKVAEPA